MKRLSLCMALAGGLVCIAGVYVLPLSMAGPSPAGQDKKTELDILLDEHKKSNFPSPALIAPLYERAKKEKNLELLKKTVDLITQYIGYINEIPEHYRRLRSRNIEIGSAQLRHANQILELIDRCVELRSDCRYEIAKILIAEGKKGEAAQFLIAAIRDSKKWDSREEKEFLALCEIKLGT